MPTFEQYGEAERVFGGIKSPVQTRIPSGQTQTEDAYAVSLAISIPPEATKMAKEFGDNSFNDQAKQTTIENSGTSQDIVNNGLASGATVEELQSAVVEKQGKLEGIDNDPNYDVGKAINLDDPEVSAAQSRFLSNQKIAYDRLTAVIEEVNGNSVMDVLDFLDVMVREILPSGTYEGLTKRSERMGEAWLNMLIQEDFAKDSTALDMMIDSYREEGIFTSDNLFAMERAREELLNSGYDPMADKIQFITAAGMLTGVSTGLGAAAKVARASKVAGNTIGTVGALQGPARAAGALTRLIPVGANATDADKTLAKHWSTAAYDPSAYPIYRPTQGIVHNLMTKNKIVQDLVDLEDMGVFGRPVSREEIIQAAEGQAEAIIKNINFPVSAYDIKPINDGMSNWRVQVDIGKTVDGSPWTNQVFAERVAERIGPEASVFDTGNGFVVRVESDVDTAFLSNRLELDTLGLDKIRNTLGKYLGASGNREPASMSSLRDIGEASIVNIREAIRPALKAYRAASGADKKYINQIIEIIRDGDKGLGIKPNKQFFTDQEFSSFYSMLSGGKTPSPTTIKAYHALIDINDADWFVKSSKLRSKFSSMGYQGVKLPDGRTVKGKKVTSVPTDEDIFDIKAGQVLDRTKQRPATTTLWQLTDEFNGHIYVANPESVRALRNADVLNYNAGGSRVRPDAHWYLGAAYGSGARAKRFKGILSATTQKQAAKATEELNSLVRVVREGLYQTGAADLRGLAGTRYEGLIDNILRTKNSWNEDIENLSDLAKYSDDVGHSFSEPFAAKASNENVTEFAGSDGMTSVRDYIDLQVNTQRTSRGIDHVGGGKSRVLDPAEAIGQQAGNSAYYLANKAYTQAAINSWVQRARPYVNFNKSINENDFTSLFNSININDISQASVEGRRLRELKAIIERRLNMPTTSSRMWESVATEMREFVFDNGSKFTGGRWQPKVNPQNYDPGAQLLKIGFFSKFGFFNPTQFIMQGYHIVNIAAISPIHGARGGALAMPLNVMMSVPYKSGAYNLMMKRLKQIPGVDGAELEELVDFYRKSGRWNVGHDVVELQGATNIVPAGVNKIKAGAGSIMQAGLMPFSQGERLGRSSAVATAFFEFKAKHPDIPISSDFARHWITTREQNLTFKMTTSNKSAAFSGPMKVPTQWLTYTSRVMENIFIGRGFTPAERVRLGLVNTVMFGMTGFGAGESTLWALDQLGLDQTEGNYLAVKYGIMDELMFQMTGERVALSSRLNVTDGLVDIYKKILDDKFIEVLFGPSSTITADIVKNGIQALSHLAHGRKAIAAEDFFQATANISTFNNLEKAMGIWHYQQSRAKNESVVGDDLNNVDGWVTLFGLTPIEVQEGYEMKFTLYNDKRKATELTKELQTMAEKAFTYLQSDNKEDADQGMRLLNDIDAIIQSSPFTFSLKASIRESLLKDNVNTIPDLIQNLVKIGRLDEALMLEKITQGTNNTDG